MDTNTLICFNIDCVDMKRICFGINLPQDVGFDIVSDFALEAEKISYDSVWYADHLYFKQGDRILECWTTLSALVAITKRIRIGSLVTCNIFRYPSIFPKIL